MLEAIEQCHWLDGQRLWTQLMPGAYRKQEAGRLCFARRIHRYESTSESTSVVDKQKEWMLYSAPDVGMEKDFILQYAPYTIGNR